MCDHFHQPVIGLIYVCQQVWQPVPVSPSMHEASVADLSECFQRGRHSLPSEKPDVVMAVLWGNGVSSATGDFPA